MRKEIATGLTLATALTLGGCQHESEPQPQKSSQESAAFKATGHALETAFSKDRAHWEQKVGYMSVKLVYVRPGQTVKCDGQEITSHKQRAPASYCRLQESVVVLAGTYNDFLGKMPQSARSASHQVVMAHELGHAMQAKRAGAFLEGEQPEPEKMADCFAGATIRETVASPERRLAIRQALPYIFASAATYHRDGPEDDHGDVQERIAAYHQGESGSDCGGLIVQE